MTRRGTAAVLEIDELTEAEAEIEPQELTSPLVEPKHEQILTLGIETSCDETAVAILEGERNVLANVVSSQVDLHSAYGGVVPDLASRAHVAAINPAIAEALRRADVTLWDLSCVAVTIGPGLIGSLIVGVAAAKSLASVLEKPLVTVNHLEAHLYANFLEHTDFGPPAIGLIVSGGHTLLVHMRAHGIYEVLGRTLDDAAGEAFDKVARFLGLDFPGGPAIDRAAASGERDAVAFPRPMSGDTYDFSFSGLKTAVITHVRREIAAENAPKTEDICASFQEAAVDVLVTKTLRAARELDVNNVFLSGGVAANSRLRARFEEETGDRDLFIPSHDYCTDNAAMIACCGFHRFTRGIHAGIDVAPDPNLPLA